jgi:hypothetical protein
MYYGLTTIFLNCPATVVIPPPVPVAEKVPESLLLALAVIITVPNVGIKGVVILAFL